MGHLPFIAFIAFILLVHTARCLRNFAVNKTAYQSSTYSTWTADKAVDGNTDGSNPYTSMTCSATAPVLGNHTWEVDIGFKIIVTTITVYERSDGNDQLSGFKVFIGNVTRPWTANLPLIEVQPRNTQHIFRVNNTLAQFVSVIRQNKDILLICEVVVEGECIQGTYGNECNEICGMCFNGVNSCSSIDGQCKIGCEAGWLGGTCKQECVRGTYGYGCNETCGMCFSGINSCSSIDGQCKIGCEAGWRGGTCKQGCDLGTYGYGCNETCGMCFRGNKSCSKIDGQCNFGCEAGWWGGTCKQACDNGTYGRECAEICGKCLKGTNSCSKIDGLCTDGCECGWRGETCKIDSSEKQTQSYPSVNAPAIGGSVGGICVIAIIVNIITVIVLKKRMNKNTSDNEIQMGEVSHDTESVIGCDNAREGFQTGDTEYEKLQDSGRIEGSAYCTINYMETDEPNVNSGEGFGIETDIYINSDVKTLQSVEKS